MCKEKIKVFILKPIMVLLTLFSAFSLIGVGYMYSVLPEEYNVNRGEKLKINTAFPVKAEYSGESLSEATTSKSMSEDYSVNLKVLGIIPIKKANVKVITDTDICVLGNPFGIKIYTDGVMVVGIDTVTTEKGNVSPGADAGLKVGDLIISMNGENVYSNEDVANIIEASEGREITLNINSEGKKKTVKVTPAKCYQSGKFKTGIWVRDSSAGIGTLTFYSPTKNTLCGLGHGVCDVDTGELLTLNSGDLVEAEILGVTKGSAGNPGELVGRFKENTIGKLLINNDTGVFGSCDLDIKDMQLTKMALKQEVEVGEAEIYTTVEGEEPKLYKCEIEKISHNNSITKNMVIHITDNKLIEKTGGIVQGMSGSPVIQNGKLVGAVTHVLVDDPTKGYAIFAENMLETAQGVAESNKLKDAS